MDTGVGEQVGRATVWRHVFDDVAEVAVDVAYAKDDIQADVVVYAERDFVDVLALDARRDERCTTAVDDATIGSQELTTRRRNRHGATARLERHFVAVGARHEARRVHTLGGELTVVDVEWNRLVEATVVEEHLRPTGPRRKLRKVVDGADTRSPVVLDVDVALAVGTVQFLAFPANTGV